MTEGFKRNRAKIKLSKFQKSQTFRQCPLYFVVTKTNNKYTLGKNK